MVSTRDLENVVAQVNVKFEELFKKIVQLEKQLAENTGAEKNAKVKKDPRLARAGVDGYNKPKRTPNHRHKKPCCCGKGR